MKGKSMGIFRQECFQSGNSNKTCFEGYYFRAVAKDGTAISTIPGISRNASDSHSFVQIIDDKGQSAYYRYSIDEFEYSNKILFLKIGENSFSSSGFKLNIGGNPGVSGMLTYHNTVYYPKNILCPNIMGPFSFLPGLECHHAVISLKSDLEGSVNLNGETIDFTGGTGYIEKDWGCSFPKKYIWAQSNCFDGHNASFMLSEASVPVFRKTIRGLISFLYFDGKFYSFTTYNGSHAEKIEKIGDLISIYVKSHSRRLFVNLKPNNTCALKAPKCGVMSREIRECGSGTIIVELQENGRTVFSGTGRSAGIEICDDNLI